MKAMILAAGLGTRLRPLTDTLPKPLLPIGGTPLVLWNLFLLRRHGITEVIINLHYLGHLIEKELGDGSRFGLRISYSREPVILGTGGGIKQAEPFFNGEPFVVLNGDTLLELDLGTVVRFHEQQNALATMVLREDPDAERWGAVETNPQQCVVRIGGRGLSKGGQTAKRMFAGVHVMHPQLLKDVPTGQASSIIDTYVNAIQRGEVIMGCGMDSYWSDVGTPERYAQAQQDVEKGRIILMARQQS